MRYFHTKCGGRIDVKERKCLRCKKKWNLLAFYFDPVGIRPVYEPAKKSSKPTGVWEASNKLASKLPKWPKWARIATVVAIVLVVIVLVRILWR